jgi:hypothetical protein
MTALNTSKRSTLRKVGVAVLVVGLLVALVLVLIELYLVPVINRTLDDKVEDFQVQIKGIKLAPWRGAYAVEGLTVRERDSPKKDPLLEVPRLDAAIDLRALLNGAFVASLALQRPVVRVFIDTTKRKSPQDTSYLDVSQAIADLAPTSLDSVVVNGGVAYLSTKLELPNGVTRALDLKATDIEIHVQNLTNSTEVSDGLFAHYTATATLEDHGKVEANGKLHPTAKSPTFEFNAKLLGLPLKKLSDWSLAFGRFSFEGGQLDVVAELASTDGVFKGYVKPLAKNVETKGMHQDAVSKVVAQVVETASGLLENKETDRVGTRIELEGRLDDPQVDVWMAVWMTLQNAFVEGLRPIIDGDIDLSSVTEVASP